MELNAENPKCTHCGLSECIYHEYKMVGPETSPISTSADFCKLGMYSVPDDQIMSYGHQQTYSRCPFYVSGDNISKNKITRNGIRKLSYILIERIKSHPEEFITNYMGVNVNWFEKWILKHIAEKLHATGYDLRRKAAEKKLQEYKEKNKDGE